MKKLGRRLKLLVPLKYRPDPLSGLEDIPRKGALRGAETDSRKPVGQFVLFVGDAFSLPSHPETIEITETSGSWSHVRHLEP